MNTLFMILAFFCQDCRNANYLTIEKEHEKALSLLQITRPTATNYKEYCYLRAVNYFALNKKKEAETWITKYNDSFNEGTRRYDTLIYIMEQNIVSWKDGDLADIERDMRISRSRLETAKAGTKTQEIQKQIIEKLDKLIKEKENEQNKQQASNSLPMPGEAEIKPMEESRISGGKGEGKFDEKKFRDYAKSWGSLPPAKRAAVLREIEQEVPKKYRILVEDYLKSLSRTNK